MPKWADEGENRVADILFGATPVDGTLYLGLYTVPTSDPAETATLSSFTEPSGNGYARKALTRGSWTVVADLASYAQQTFTCSGGGWGSIYGAFIATSVDNSGKLLAIDHFPSGPYAMQADGFQLLYTPKIRVA